VDDAMTTALGDRADVHAQTLRAVAAGVRTPVIRATRQVTTTRSRSGAVRTIKVHEWVWEVALILADGDARRIEIESETTVIVR
jgi:hypothetical protein